MAYASLSIDLKAQLANLQSGMDKAVRLAEKDAARMEKAFGAVKIAAGTIGGAFAAALGGATLTAFIVQTNDALLAIKDLAEGTGSTVENISALENALRANNRTLDEAQPVLVKFNAALKEADGKNGISKALEAIGLSADELRRLDPVQALQQVAKALQGFNDDGNKARLVQELFGKSVAEVIPLLNDLADSQLKATDGIRQATEEADKFEKNLAKLKAEATDLARTLAGPLVAGLNKVFDTLKGGTSQDLDITRRQITLLVDYINKNGDSPALPKLVSRLKELRDREQALAGQLPAGSGRPANEGGGGLATLRNLPAIGNTTAAARAARGTAGPRDFVGPEVPEALAAALKLLERTDVQKLQDLQQQLDELLSLRSAGGDRPDLAEAITDVSLAIDELNSKKFAPQVDIKSDFLRSEKAGYEETDALLRKLQEDSKKLNGIGEELGLTFSSAFEDAIVGGKGLREVLQGLEQDILRIVTRKLVTEPLGNAITGIIKGATGDGGFDFGSILGKIAGSIGGLFGGFFADGGYLPPGKWGIAGERGPEPIFGGRTGMTVQPAGGGQIVQHFHLTGAADRSTQQQVFAAAARGLAMAGRNN